MSKAGDNRKRGRKVRVEMRKNRGKPGRAKDWTRQFKTGTEKQQDTALNENVRHKGDLSRKRTMIVDQAAEQNLLRGTVVAMRGLVAEIDDGKQIWACTVRRKLRTLLIAERVPIAVG